MYSVIAVQCGAWQCCGARRRIHRTRATSAKREEQAPHVRHEHHEKAEKGSKGHHRPVHCYEQRNERGKPRRRNERGLERGKMADGGPDKGPGRGRPPVWANMGKQLHGAHTAGAQRAWQAEHWPLSQKSRRQSTVSGCPIPTHLHLRLCTTTVHSHQVLKDQVACHPPASLVMASIAGQSCVPSFSTTDCWNMTCSAASSGGAVSSKEGLHIASIEEPLRGKAGQQSAHPQAV